MKFLGLIWSSMKRKKLRSVLTLLSVFVAFLLFGILCILKESLTGGVSATAGADARRAAASDRQAARRRSGLRNGAAERTAERGGLATITLRIL